MGYSAVLPNILENLANGHMSDTFTHARRQNESLRGSIRSLIGNLETEPGLKGVMRDNTSLNASGARQKHVGFMGETKQKKGGFKALTPASDHRADEHSFRYNHFKKRLEEIQSRRQKKDDGEATGQRVKTVVPPQAGSTEGLSRDSLQLLLKRIEDQNGQIIDLENKLLENSSKTHMLDMPNEAEGVRGRHYVDYGAQALRKPRDEHSLARTRSGAQATRPLVENQPDFLVELRQWQRIRDLEAENSDLKRKNREIMIKAQTLAQMHRDKVQELRNRLQASNEVIGYLTSGNRQDAESDLESTLQLLYGDSTTMQLLRGSKAKLASRSRNLRSYAIAVLFTIRLQRAAMLGWGS